MTDWVVLIIVGIILLTQSIFLFLHARRHGHSYWFWGIIGLIQAPVPTIVYFLFVRKVYKRWKLSIMKQIFLTASKISHLLFLISLFLSWNSFISWKPTIIFILLHGIFLVGLILILLYERKKEKEEDDKNDYRNY